VFGPRPDPYEAMEVQFEKIFSKPPEVLGGSIIVRLSSVERYDLSPQCVGELLRNANSLVHPHIIDRHLKCGFDVARRIQLTLITQ